MDNIMGLLTSTEGRIGRGRWWLGVVIIIVLAIILSIILSLVGLGVMPGFGATFDATNPQAVMDAAAKASRSAAWGSIISFVIFAYPSYALGIKRRHDRDNNGLDLQIYYVLTFIVLLIQALGIGMTTTDVGNGILVPVPSLPITLLSVVLGIYAIYLLVVMGFLRGTAGPNQYGPDPLGGGA